ncbi:Uncharacterised protein [Actinobaculum suis]|uniref:Uncharacterized protein n=1 Tax=Actinobaculum suis TaxID=1657 RepID=A0A1B9BEA6_9ACTO|nr:hypothetical protein [Actinobaculum suis]OCA95842.1 hypothetical protein ACU21_00235 [Actinobaculum suis]VDG76809.1 Uncharacterised protein [Actinobaculum suis]
MKKRRQNSPAGAYDPAAYEAGASGGSASGAGVLGASVPGASASGVATTPSTPPPHRSSPVLRAIAWSVLALIVIIGIFAGLGVRFGETKPQIPPASPAEQARQKVAIQAARVAETAAALTHANAGGGANGRAGDGGGNAGGSGDNAGGTATGAGEAGSNAGTSAVYEQVQAHANEFLTQLGGVWQPWPSGAPSPYTNPPLDTAAPADPQASNLLNQVQELREAAIAAAETVVPDTDSSETAAGTDSSETAAVTGAAPNSRPLYLSIALRSHFDAMQIAQAAGLEIPSCEFAAGATVQMDAVSVGRSFAGADPHFLRQAAAARQWIETATSRLEPGQRDAQLARIDKLTAFEEGMLQTGMEDTRDIAAPYPEDQSSPALLAQGLNTYAGVLVSGPGEPRAALTFACSLYLDDAERATAPTLPGLQNPGSA